MTASLKVLVPEATTNYIQNPSFRYGSSIAYTNDPAAGNNIELNVPDTSGFAVGDKVEVSSSAGTEVATITVVHTDVHITVDTLTLNHTTTNPLIKSEGLTVGWKAVGATIKRVLTYALYGISSLMVVTNGLASREGTFYRVNSLVGISEPITISASVRGAGTVQLRLIEGLGKEWISEPTTLYPDHWTRMEVTGFSTGNNDMRLYVETAGSTPMAITFCVDGTQMERKPYATTYVDGDQPGCRWNIMDCASNPTRDADTRQGGRWVELAGPCRSNTDIYITLVSGMGMPPIQNNLQSWALSPGSFFQSTKILDRVVNITFHIKNPSLRIIRNPDSSPLHKLRQQLIDIFKPDLTGGSEPFLFSYKEGERELFLNMRYEGGLNGSWDIRNQWMDSMPLRFLVVDPLFYENNYHAQALTFKEDAIFNGVAGRVNGRWSNLNYGMGVFGVNNMEVGKLGQIYAGGPFVTANYSALAIDPLIPVNHIAYWDGIKWNAIDVGSDGIQITRIAIASNGDVYAVGDFTNIGGVAANRIAKWNRTVWSALGTGFDAVAGGLAIAPNGDIYASGAFLTAGGVTVNRIARWDGSAWHAMGVRPGLNDNVNTLTITPDGSTLYIGGEFTDQFGLAANAMLHIAKYDPTTNLFTALRSGFDDDVREVRLSPSGFLYAVGDFINSGTNVMNRIAKWNGNMWVALSSGVSGGYISSLAIDEDGKIAVTGSFTSASGISARNLALWNGSTWTHMDILLAGGMWTPIPYAVRFSGEDIYVGGASFSYYQTYKSLYASINTVVNRGTAEVRPIIYVYGPGRLRWIENQTNNKRIYLDMTILDNEEVFFDFAKSKVWSTVRGDLTYAVLPGSDFADFTLIPGSNKLAVFMTDDVDSKMYIYYRPQHWSADATVNAEALP